MRWALFAHFTDEEIGSERVRLCPFQSQCVGGAGEGVWERLVGKPQEGDL